MKMRNFWIRTVIAIILVLCCRPVTADTPESWSWESLVAAYGGAGELRQAAEALHRELAATMTETMDEAKLWESMWTERDPRRRASMALALVDRLFPGGDPGRWEEVEGFWHPALVSRSLASLDAVYVAGLSLLAMSDDAAEFLALHLFRRLSGSPRARYHALLNAPEEYGQIRARMDNISPPLPHGILVGRLPLAHPVRGWITEDRALQLGATFLDGFGGVSRGGGPYAWDRREGRIYRVRDGRERLRWFIWD